jgi:hypothetical protein
MQICKISTSPAISLPKGLLICCTFCLIFCSSFLATAVPRTSSQAGPWNSTATWGGQSVPVNGDDVTIAHAVTVPADAVCSSLTINAAATLTISANVIVNGSVTYVAPNANNTITISSGSLTVTGNVSMAAPASNTRASTLAVGDGTLTVGGMFTMATGTTASRGNVITIAGGTANLNGGYTTGTAVGTIAAGCKLTFTGSGVLNIAGTVGGGAPALTQSTGTVNFTGAGSQGVWIETYYNLGVQNGTKNTLGAVTVSNNLNVTSAAFTTGGTLSAFNLNLYSGSVTLGGTFTSAGTLNIAGGTFNGVTYAITLSGSGSAFLCAGTFNQGTGLVTLSGATTIPQTTFNNLTLTGSVVRTIPDGTMVTVNGNLAQAGDLVFAGSGSAYVKGIYSGFGTLTMGSGTLSLDSSYTASATFTPGTGTVKYVGDGGAVKVNWNYYNLEFDGSRSITGAVNVANVLTINSGKTLSMGTSPVNLNGNGNPIVNNGTIVSTSGALVFAGTGTQVIAAGNYPKTTLTGGAKTIPGGATVTIAGAFAITAPLTMEANSTANITGAVTMSSPLTVENGSALNINGTFAANAQVTYNGNASGTFTGAVSGSGATTMSTGTLTFQSTFTGGAFDPGTGKVVYDGTAAQAVRVGVNYYNLELSSSVSNSIASTTMTIANNLTIDSPTTLNGSATLNIGNDLLGNAQLTASGVINLQGDWLHTGTVVPGTGTIHYNGGNQSVKNFSYYKLSLTGGVKAMNGNITATNLVQINADTELAMNGHTLELQGPTGNAMTNLGILTGNGKVWYSLAGAQTVNSSTFYDLEFTGGAKTINTGANIITTNDWIVSATVTMSSTQNATVGRDLIHNAAGFIDQGSGTIRIGRNWVYNGGTFDAAQGTVIYEGANQTIAPFTYGTLICDGSGTKSITGDILINGVLTINPGVTFDRAAYTVTLPFNGTPFVNNGTLTGNGKFFYTGTGTQNIAAGSYYDLEFTTGTKNLPANETVEILNDWTVGSGTVFGTNTTVSVSGDISGAGTLTLGNGTLNLAGSWNKTGTFTASNTGIFHYNGADQNIAALDYYKLQISNAGTKSLTANTTVRDVLTVNSGSTLGLATFTLTLPLAGTPFVNQGEMLPGASTVLYTAAGATEIAPGSYYNLTTSGGARSLANGGTYEIGGAFTPGSTTFSSVTGSTVNFNGTAAQTIPPFTFYKLILSGANDKSVLTATSVTAYELEVQDSAVLNIDGTGQVNLTKP